MWARRSLAPVTGCVALLLLTAACGGGSGERSSPPTDGSTGVLGSVCPASIVVQTSWQPESEHGALYQLLGPGYAIDTKRKIITGPLVVGGRDTGVQLEIRSGGPAVGFQAVPAMMYLDTSIHLGQVSTDLSVAFAGSGQPTTAVVAPLDISPLAILWDPGAIPRSQDCRRPRQE
jgi:hypothetical protein